MSFHLFALPHLHTCAVTTSEGREKHASLGHQQEIHTAVVVFSHTARAHLVVVLAGFVVLSQLSTLGLTVSSS